METQQTDHDLLIVLNTELQGMRKDVQDIKDSLKDSFGDHESRIRLLEDSKSEGKGAQKVWAAVSGVVGAGVALAAQYVIQHK